MEKPATSPTAWQQFLNAFGDAPEAVAKKIEAYWQSEPSSPFPADVYNHLVEARITCGKITRERGDFLKDYFAESFAPEQVTGYADKHREPLVTAMVEAYNQAVPNKPIFRVEADIMNLGGLNKALGEKRADEVIRLMSQKLREALAGNALIGKNDVCDIRLGGDELLLFVRPQVGDKTLAAIKQTLAAVQNEIAVFISTANLGDVEHVKPGRESGIGIGCAAIQLHSSQTKLQRHRDIEAGIKLGKQDFLEALGFPSTNGNVSEKSVAQLLEQQEYKRYAAVPAPAFQPLRKGDGAHSGKSPEDARFARIQRHMDALPSVNAELESAMLDGLHTLTQHRDPVTGLLMFGDMETQVLPNFSTHHVGHKAKARLVHFDFNNLGGANLLGHWVGNAASQQFTQSIKTAMTIVGLEKYIPYLTSQSANKFGLLLPMNIDTKKIEALNTEVENELYRRMKEPLKFDGKKFDGEELSYILENMKANPDKYPKAAPTNQLTDVTMLDMVNAKALKFKGSHVMCSHKVIDVNAPKLGDAISALEKTVQGKHVRKDAWIERPKSRTHVKVTKNDKVSYVERVERIPPNPRSPKALEIEGGKIIGPKALSELNRKENAEEITR